MYFVAEELRSLTSDPAATLHRIVLARTFTISKAFFKRLINMTNIEICHINLRISLINPIIDLRKMEEGKNENKNYDRQRL